jgi:ornithine cyclodeaminase/alanine dehydrogenase-like protein (mu-crystallin family)
MQARRNLDHLEYDENLYDFMRSLIPFSLTTSNRAVNEHLLSDNGIEKG